MISRAPTPMPRIVHRQYSDPFARSPSRIEHREYYDGPTSVVEETREKSRPTRPRSRSHSRATTIVSVPASRSSMASRHVSESDDSEYYNCRRQSQDGIRGRGRSRSVSRGNRCRSRSRQGIEDEGSVFSLSRWLSWKDSLAHCIQIILMVLRVAIYEHLLPHHHHHSDHRR